MFAPQALLLALAAKLRVSRSGGLAQPPRHPSYGPRHPRADRAAGFLGACFPTAQGSNWGAKQVWVCPATRVYHAMMLFGLHVIHHI